MIRRRFESRKEDGTERETLAYRTMLVVSLIALGAALRLAPHPWNFTPVGAIALFSGAMVRHRQAAYFFPILVMGATDLIVGFNKLSPLVYASLILSVFIGRFLMQKRHLLRLGAATLLGALQFFLITNFGVWAFLGSYPRTAAGLVECYLAGMPFFWNTLASDAFYVSLLFGTVHLAEQFAPRIRQALPSDF